MENFSKRTTAILAATFLLMSVGWGFAVQQMGTPVEPPLHCDCHFPKITCTPVAHS